MTAYKFDKNNHSVYSLNYIKNNNIHIHTKCMEMENMEKKTRYSKKMCGM